MTVRVLPLLLLVIIMTGCGDHEQLSALDQVQSLYNTQCASFMNGQTDAFWETRTQNYVDIGLSGKQKARAVTERQMSEISKSLRNVSCKYQALRLVSLGKTVEVIARESVAGEVPRGKGTTTIRVSGLYRDSFVREGQTLLQSSSRALQQRTYVNGRLVINRI